MLVYGLEPNYRQPFNLSSSETPNAVALNIVGVSGKHVVKMEINASDVEATGIKST